MCFGELLLYIWIYPNHLFHCYACLQRYLYPLQSQRRTLTLKHELWCTTALISVTTLSVQSRLDAYFAKFFQGLIKSSRRMCKKLVYHGVKITTFLYLIYLMAAIFQQSTIVCDFTHKPKIALSFSANLILFILLQVLIVGRL